jgi:hypothetical protein
MIPSFSLSRFYAYDRGQSVYSNSISSSVSKMLPGFDRYGFITDAPRPALSLSFILPRNSLHDPEAVLKSLAQSDLHLTIVCNRNRLSHSTEHSLESTVLSPGEHGSALSIISKLTQTMRQIHSLADLRVCGLSRQGIASDIGLLLRLANNRVAREVYDSKLPCLYQSYKKPDQTEIEALQSAVTLLGDQVPTLLPFAHRPSDELLQDGEALGQFLAGIQELKPQLGTVIRLPHMAEVISLQPRPAEALSTIPFSVKGASLRNLAAFVAQHQLLAARGVLYDPLSAGEVGMLLQQLEGHEAEAYKIRNELDLFEELRLLQTVPGSLKARVTSKHSDALPTLELVGSLRLGKRCVLNELLSSLLASGFDIRNGDTIDVIPLHYNIMSRCFVFHYAPPRS